MARIVTGSALCSIIEKKPFYHFHPGTFALTAGSTSVQDMPSSARQAASSGRAASDVLMEVGADADHLCSFRCHW